MQSMSCLNHDWRNKMTWQWKVRTATVISVMVVSTILLTACASTDLVNSWRDPEFKGKLASLVVVGVSKQAAVRRIFEDAFAKQLQSKGIRAVPSYTLIPQDGPIAEQRLRAAVESADTDGVIITRLVDIRSKVSVIYPGPAVVPYPYYGPYYYGYYSAAWASYYEPPVVQQYDIVTSETTVFARGRAQPVWSGTTETTAPGDLAKETVGFAKVVIKKLEQQGVIQAAPKSADKSG